MRGAACGPPTAVAKAGFAEADYGLVVDMFEANYRIYQVAGMKEGDPRPLKDPDIRESMTSFKLLSR